MDNTEYISNTLRDYRDTVAQQQNTISQLIGGNYPSRAVVEHALKTQTGSVLNLSKAKQEFFNQLQKQAGE
jgi:hypothetical protein